MSAIKEILTPANWEATPNKEKLFSGDHVIDAYIKGKSDGIKDLKEQLKTKINKNLNLAGANTNQLINYLKKKGFHPKSAYLKINSLDDFLVLVILPEAEFLSPEILPVYKYISTLEKKASPHYRLKFSIYDVQDDINVHALNSDGFNLRHKTL